MHAVRRTVDEVQTERGSLRGGERGERSALRLFRGRVDLVEQRGEQLPIALAHELAIEAIDERGDADVDGAGRIGARQDAFGRRAECRALPGREIGARRGRLRARGVVEPVRCDRDAGEQRRPPDCLTTTDLVARRRSFARRVAHRLRLLISETA